MLTSIQFASSPNRSIGDTLRKVSAISGTVVIAAMLNLLTSSAWAMPVKIVKFIDDPANMLLILKSTNAVANFKYTIPDSLGETWLVTGTVVEAAAAAANNSNVTVNITVQHNLGLHDGETANKNSIPLSFSFEAGKGVGDAELKAGVTARYEATKPAVKHTGKVDHYDSAECDVAATTDKPGKGIVKYTLVCGAGHSVNPKEGSKLAAISPSDSSTDATGFYFIDPTTGEFSASIMVDGLPATSIMDANITDSSGASIFPIGSSCFADSSADGDVSAICTLESASFPNNNGEIGLLTSGALTLQITTSSGTMSGIIPAASFETVIEETTTETD